MSTRTHTWMAGLITAALMLTACTATKPAGPAATAPSAAPQTRTVADAFGKPQVPAAPKRIVAADLGTFIPTFGVLAALGVHPVAVTADQVPDYLAPYAAGVKILPGQPNYEAIAALQPDLIITPGIDYNRKNYDAMGKVAPTAGPAWYWQTLDQVTGHWKAVAELVGETAKGEQLVTDLQAQVAGVRQKLGPQMKERTVSVLQVQAPMNIFLQTGRLESALLSAVGVPRPANQTYDPTNKQWYVQLSPERLAEADAWAIFVEVYAAKPGDIAATQKALEANPLWSKLKAVQNGRVFYVKTDEWSGTDPFMAKMILNTIERDLTSALEKQ